MRESSQAPKQLQSWQWSHEPPTGARAGRARGGTRGGPTNPARARGARGAPRPGLSLHPATPPALPPLERSAGVLADADCDIRFLGMLVPDQESFIFTQRPQI